MISIWKENKNNIPYIDGDREKGREEKRFLGHYIIFLTKCSYTCTVYPVHKSSKKSNFRQHTLRYLSRRNTRLIILH